MSDLEQMRAMLDRAQIVYSEPSNPDKRCIIETAREIEIKAKDGPANFGYRGFVTNWGFSAEGDLLWVGTWE